MPYKPGDTEDARRVSVLKERFKLEGKARFKKDFKRFEFDKEVKAVIKWLATEHSFFNDLAKDMDQLSYDIAHARDRIPKVQPAKMGATANEKAVIDFKRALKSCKAIGKSEKRLEKHEQNVERIIQKMRDYPIDVVGMTVGELDQLLKHLHAEAAELINVSSRFEGKIVELVHDLIDKVKEEDLKGAERYIWNIKRVVDRTQKWIAALSADLQRASELAYNPL